MVVTALSYEKPVGLCVLLTIKKGSCHTKNIFKVAVLGVSGKDGVLSSLLSTRTKLP